MNEESLGLIIFALIALGAVFAFIIILGGPETTGQLAGTQKLGTSYYKYRDAIEACSKGTHCSSGLPAVPTGVYDPFIGAYQCQCSTAERPIDLGWQQDQNKYFWRTPYGPPG